MKKILILTGGNKAKIEGFNVASKNLNIDVTTASFSELNFTSGEEYSLYIGQVDLKEFSLIYIRLVGKRIEEASLVVNYAKKHNIRIVDYVYESALFLPSTISKAVELSKLIDAGVPIPKTLYGSVTQIKQKSPTLFGYPFVIKSTSGRKAQEVWSPQNEQDLIVLCEKFLEMEKAGKKFFAQEFLYASQRERAFVLGRKVVAIITRPTKWRKRFTEVEGKKEMVEITESLSSLALSATKAVGLDIAGVDIMTDEKSGQSYIIEVNAAPAWKLIKKDTGMNVEEEILKFLVSSI